jgi:hypothetical protein
MLTQLALFFVYFVAMVMLGIFLWGSVMVGIELFKHRGMGGITYFDGGKQYDLSRWFEPLHGEGYYGHPL